MKKSSKDEANISYIQELYLKFKDAYEESEFTALYAGELNSRLFYYLKNYFLLDYPRAEKLVTFSNIQESETKQSEVILSNIQETKQSEIILSNIQESEKRQSEVTSNIQDSEKQQSEVTLNIQESETRKSNDLGGEADEEETNVRSDDDEIVEVLESEDSCDPIVLNNIELDELTRRNRQSCILAFFWEITTSDAYECLTADVDNIPLKIKYFDKRFAHGVLVSSNNSIFENIWVSRDLFLRNKIKEYRHLSNESLGQKIKEAWDMKPKIYNKEFSKLFTEDEREKAMEIFDSLLFI